MATRSFSSSTVGYVAPKGDNTASVEAAIAVLEADGAAPTQAHVNSLRTVWNTLKSGNVIVTIDTAAVTTRTQLRAALDAVMFNLQGSDLLTP
jgi:hypothetical protein